MNVYPSGFDLRDVFGANDAAGARLVLDDHGLADLLGEHLGDGARAVVGYAARRERHDDR